MGMVCTLLGSAFKVYAPTVLLRHADSDLLSTAVGRLYYGLRDILGLDFEAFVGIGRQQRHDRVVPEQDGSGYRPRGLGCWV